MLPTILCLATSRDQAQQIVDRLQSADIPVASVSALAFGPDQSSRPAPLTGLGHAGVDDPAKVNAAGGAATGAVTGAAAGVGVMSIVGLTPFLMIAPLIVGGAAALGSAVGAGAGAAYSGLSDFGIPESRTAEYEQALAGGGWLIAVRTEDESILQRAQTVFEQSGGQHIALNRLTKKLT